MASHAGTMYCKRHFNRKTTQIEKVKAKHVKEDKLCGEECSICSEEIDLDTQKTLPCGHSFHLSCVFDWTVVFKHPSCPMCRAAVIVPVSDSKKDKSVVEFDRVIQEFIESAQNATVKSTEEVYRKIAERFHAILYSNMGMGKMKEALTEVYAQVRTQREQLN